MIYLTELRISATKCHYVFKVGLLSGIEEMSRYSNILSFAKLC